MTNPQSTRDLNSFFDPSSVAVVGASDVPGKWGHAIAQGVLRGIDRRAVYLVNPTGREILGQPSYRTLEDVPETPELVVLTVPLAGFDASVDAALSRGVKAIVAINAGFAELGVAGAEHQRTLVSRVREAGALLIGPNCMGVVDNTTTLDASWFPSGTISTGSVAVVSQSGNLGLEIANQLSDAGLGVSRWVSLGNQADVGISDAIRSFTAHDPTDLIAVYCEDFRDGRAFLRAAREAVSAGKPVIVLAAGGDPATARAARSHTGSLTTDDGVVEAACRACGALKVLTPTQLVDAALVLLGPGAPRGERVAVLADGGGHAVVATNVVTLAGFKVEPFSEGLRAALKSATNETTATGNPVDLASANVDPTAMGRVIAAVIESEEVDAIVMSGAFGVQEIVDPQLGELELESARRIAQAIAGAELPMVVHSVVPDTNANAALREVGIPVFKEVERAVQALQLAAEAAAARPGEIDELAGESTAPAANGYFGARQLLSDAGISFPAAREVRTLAEASEAAREIGYPVALKAVSLLHKSDAGGVALDLSDDGALRRAFERMDTTIAAEQYSVEAMVNEADAVELVIGCRRDPRFGPVLLVGLGGIYAEVLKDFQLQLAPASADAVHSLLDALRGAPLLHGLRGRQPVALDAVCEAAARLSELAVRHPTISEIEVNPLLAHPGGAIALDARIVPVEEATAVETSLSFTPRR